MQRLIYAKEHADMHRLVRVDPDNDADSASGDLLQCVTLVLQLAVHLTLHVECSPVLIRRIPLPIRDSSRLLVDGKVVTTGVRNGRRRIEYISSDASVDGHNAKTRTVWKSPRDVSQLESRVTSMLPIDFDNIIIGCSGSSYLLISW